MQNTTIIEALENVYAHWVSFENCSIVYFDNRDQEPYILGNDELCIDDIAVGTEIKEVRFKKSEISMFIYYDNKYYIFQQNSFDENQTTSTITDFLDDANLSYVFGQYDTSIAPGNFSHETNN